MSTTTPKSPKTSSGITIEQISRTVHRVGISGGERMLFISDVHFDAVKCDRDMLRRHLNQAKKDGASVFIFGDWFDLMQGKWDPRGTYSDLRPEYKSIRYLDDVIDDTVAFFENYKGVIRFMGRGNHETNIEKRMHTSPLDRVAALHNANGGNITVAGYAGWLLMNMVRGNGRTRAVSKVHYHHGYGGNAPRSKGVLAVDIDQMQFPDADIIVRGHTHQKVDGAVGGGSVQLQRCAVTAAGQPPAPGQLQEAGRPLRRMEHREGVQHADARRVVADSNAQPSNRKDRMEDNRGKLKDTKLGAWFRDKAPDVLASVGEVIPGGQVLKAVGALIDATTTSETEKQEARALLYQLQQEDVENARKREVDLAEATGGHDWMQRAVGITGLVAFVVTLVFAFIGDVNNEVLFHILGVVEGVAITIFGYYFGGSIK
jgi:UDP-2,3-diacylglucosamine pyrophosphatase LpxH